MELHADLILTELRDASDFGSLKVVASQPSHIWVTREELATREDVRLRRVARMAKRGRRRARPRRVGQYLTTTLLIWQYSRSAS